MSSSTPHTPTASPCGFFSATAQDVPLAPSPIEPAWIKSGEPQAEIATWAHSADERLMAAIWRCTAGVFDWHFGSDEIVHIMEGSVDVTGPDGTTATLNAGDVGFFPAGTVWQWSIDDYVLKHAIVRAVPPKPVATVWNVGAKLKAALKGDSAPAGL